MATYRQADKEVSELVAVVAAEFYGELVEHGVTIECLFAHAKKDDSGEIAQPALRHHGWPAAAIVKVNSQRDRAAGLCDARITFDGDKWPEWTDAFKRAVVDHELQHLELVLDEEGGVKLDDCFRPMLRLRQHDWQVGGFHAIMTRHGKESPEWVTLQDIIKDVSAWIPGVVGGAE